MFLHAYEVQDYDAMFVCSELLQANTDEVNGRVICNSSHDAAPAGHRGQCDPNPSVPDATDTNTGVLARDMMYISEYFL